MTLHRAGWRLARHLALALLGTGALCAVSPAAGADWPTFGGNPSRSAWLRNDSGFTRDNVRRLRRRWVTALGAVADSTPVFASAVRLSGGRTAALLFQTDRQGTTYGIEASSGAIRWRFRTSGPNITASTPVLGPSGRDLYAPGVDGRVHRLDAATGRELRSPGFPARITRMPDIEKDASALNLSSGKLYAATSGYFGDAGPYDGHVVTVDLAGGAARVFNSLCTNLHELLLDRSYDARSSASCSSIRSGIWARAGVVVDPDPSMHGRIYVATGNGPYDGRHDYGDSVLALDAAGRRITDSFTPRDYARLADSDLDLGSTAPAMLPREPRSKTPLMAVQGGKSQVLYLLDRAHLGGVGGAMQDVSLPYELFSAPAVWRDERGTTWIYLGFLPDSHSMIAFTLDTDAHGRSRLRRAWGAAIGATSPVATSGVVFVAGDGALTALDARSGAVLWSSRERSAGGTIGSIHWESPIAVNGSVYVSDEDARLSAYSLSSR